MARKMTEAERKAKADAEMQERIYRNVHARMVDLGLWTPVPEPTRKGRAKKKPKGG